MALSNQELKKAALIGLHHRRDQVDEQIQQLERELRGAGESRRAAAAPARRKKRVLSAAGRKRIADAQRKRWAATRAQKERPATKRAASKKLGRNARSTAKTMAATG